MPNVYSGGTFDLLHEGHLELLEACRRMAGPEGRVIIGLNTDEFVVRSKGVAPVQSYKTRAALLKVNKYVDFVVPNFGEWESTKTIDAVIHNGKFLLTGQVYDEDGPVVINAPGLSIDAVFIGTDWIAPGKDYYVQMGFTKGWLDERNIILAYIDRRTGESTTAIKQRVKGG